MQWSKFRGPLHCSLQICKSPCQYFHVASRRVVSPIVSFDLEQPPRANEISTTQIAFPQKPRMYGRVEIAPEPATRNKKTCWTTTAPQTPTKGQRTAAARSGTSGCFGHGPCGPGWSFLGSSNLTLARRSNCFHNGHLAGVSPVFQTHVGNGHVPIILQHKLASQSADEIPVGQRELKGEIAYCMVRGVVSAARDPLVDFARWRNL